MRIDAHHHLWRYYAQEFGWLEGELTALRRDFLRDDLLHAMRAAGVDGAVAVQARQSVAETDWLLDVARETPEILGVVGWLPLRSPSLPALLEHYSDVDKLCGVRHVVQGEPAGFMDAGEFRNGIATLADAGLTYDILIREHQLEEATRLVDSFPRQRFVLDHLGKPRAAAQELEPWASRLRSLAERPNVQCKLSGMVTEAGPGWTPGQLQPYFEAALEAFTPARLMVGSDWPVLLAHSTYEDWWGLVCTWISRLSESEQHSILGGNAQSFYGLAAAAGSTKKRS